MQLSGTFQRECSSLLQLIARAIDTIVSRAVAKREEDAAVERALKVMQLNMELVQKMLVAVAASDTRKVMITSRLVS